MKRFWAALQAEPNDVARDFFIMALLTGARRSNVLAMAWQDVDLKAKNWRIPHTKAGGSLTVPLVDHVVTLLKRRKKQAVNGYVFPGEGEAGHYAEPRKAWARILKAAELDDVHIHDLRRTLGTALASTGANMAQSMRVLGHSDQRSLDLPTSRGRPGAAGRERRRRRHPRQGRRQEARGEEASRRGRPGSAMTAIIEWTLQELDLERQRFEAGDGMALLAAIRKCANHNLAMPAWVADAFIERYGSRAYSAVVNIGDRRSAEE
ncbi:MAG: site-specific integrase [Betaproteobacteria bacterium]|nr:site-specific integrase [Betaproteobacteria bacterium]